MKTLAQRVAVVTGAANGIGRALAQRLAAEGAKLALCDVDEKGLAETVAGLSGTQVITRRVDVSKEAEVNAFADDVQRELGGANLLINNAGVALLGAFEDVSAKDFEWLMGINFWGVVYGTRAFLPQLTSKDEAHLVNLSSVFGLIAPSGQTAYSSAKFAVRGFTEALRHEYAGSRLGITVVHPGGIRTGIVARARTTATLSPENAGQISREFTRAARTSPESAADTIVRAVLRNKSRVLVGPDAYVLDRVVRSLPEAYWSVLGKVMDPRGWYRARGAR